MAFQGDSIFWVDTEKVVPNPFQPRREFDQNKLQELSESIRMYGVLQPLTVTRSEVQRDDGTFYTEYELIAGERRLRASRLANIAQVPVIIREGEQNEQEKLELAIIENLQREDLNAIDRALAFAQLADQFSLSHTQVAQKVGRSREYVSNSIRLLALPDHMKSALQRGELGEGHARTLLMLTDRPEEQEVIFREILLKKMSVREVERIVRKIASDKVRKPRDTDIDDHLVEIEKEFTETLGTRVQILKTEFGGKLTIDYFSEEDLSAILVRMKTEVKGGSVSQAPAQQLAAVLAATPLESVQSTDAPAQQTTIRPDEAIASSHPVVPPTPAPVAVPPVAPVSTYVTPAPQTATVPEVVPSTGEVSVPDAPAPQVTTQPVAPAPQADPGLLAKLAAHTSFGFSRPEPVSHTPAVQPEVAPLPPVSETPVQVAPPVPVVVEEEPEDDIYSVRNFSI